jgi:hypothetical protein
MSKEPNFSMHDVELFPADDTFVKIPRAHFGRESTIEEDLEDFLQKHSEDKNIYPLLSYIKDVIFTWNNNRESFKKVKWAYNKLLDSHVRIIDLNDFDRLQVLLKILREENENK